MLQYAMGRARSATVPSLFVALPLLILACQETSNAPDVETFDDRMAAIAETEDPGFGGYFYDANGILQVYHQNPDAANVDHILGTLSALRAASTEAVNGKATPLDAKTAAESVMFLRADYNFAQLHRWRREISSVFSIPYVLSTDTDETRNRLVVGVQRGHLAETRGRVLDLVRRAGVPGGAALVEEVAPVQPLIALDDSFDPNPAPGGVRINGGNGFCTLGFNAFISTGPESRREGIVTASHCSNCPFSRSECGFPSLPDRTWFHQASYPVDPIHAYEVIDPPLFEGGVCPPGRSCRFSDSLWAEVEPGAALDAPRIARTKFVGTNGAPGSLDIDPANPRFEITSKYPHPLVGEVLHKVGSTTGWTSGQVIFTCVDITPNFSFGETILCSHGVRTKVGGGDSGSPVFRWSGSESVSLAGVLWGGDVDETTFLYSPIQQVEADLGKLIVTQKSSGTGTRDPNRCHEVLHAIGGAPYQTQQTCEDDLFAHRNRLYEVAKTNCVQWGERYLTTFGPDPRGSGSCRFNSGNSKWYPPNFIYTCCGL